MLYQQIRPISLDQIIGNELIISSLREIIKRTHTERPHAFLFCGPSGCGKTTIARILAKQFGSKDFSIYELNAANTRGIDTIREINSWISYTSKADISAYIFDESHQLTPDAQEALLKILEDTPKNVYFFLCTTNQKGIIPTIRNRCAIYNLTCLSSEEMIELLDRACKHINETIPDDILCEIITASQGIPRTALILLEQILGQDKASILKFLYNGTEKDENIISICKLLYLIPEKRKKRWKEILTIFDKIEEDPEKIRKSILTFLYHKILEAETEEEAEELANIISLFIPSVYYGGKSQLAAMIIRACFNIKGA